MTDDDASRPVSPDDIPAPGPAPDSAAETAPEPAPGTAPDASAPDESAAQDAPRGGPDEWRPYPATPGPDAGTGAQPGAVPPASPWPAPNQHPGNPYPVPPYPAPPYPAPPYAADPYAQSPYTAGSQAPYNPYGAPSPVRPVAPEPGAAVRWAWSRFTANVGVLIGAALLWGLIVIVAAASAVLAATLLILAFTGPDTTIFYPAPSATFMLAAMIPTALVMALLAAVATSCWLTGLITIADGRRAVLGDFFAPTAFGSIFAITLIVMVISLAADVLFTDLLGVSWLSSIVSLVISFLTMWTFYLAADAGAPAGAALRDGISLATANLAPTLAVLGIAIVFSLLGVLALLVGLLVAIPVVALVTLYMFRALTGRPIAA